MTDDHGADEPGAALQVAQAYHRAWTGGDFDQAMTYIADDIVCLAPAGRLDGAEAFRGFMGPFAQILTRSSLLAAFGDEDTAVVMYGHRHRSSEGRPRRGVRYRRRREDHAHADHLRPSAVRRRPRLCDHGMNDEAERQIRRARGQRLLDRLAADDLGGARVDRAAMFGSTGLRSARSSSPSSEPTGS